MRRTGPKGLMLVVVANAMASVVLLTPPAGAQSQSADDLSRAAAAADDAHTPGVAAALREQFVSLFPSIAAREARQLAANYASMAEYDLAAGSLELVDRSDPAAPQALRNAIIYRVALGNLDLAERDAETLTRISPDAAADVWREVATGCEQYTNWPAAERAWRRYLDVTAHESGRDARTIGLAGVARARFNLRDGVGARRAWKAVAGMWLEVPGEEVHAGPTATPPKRHRASQRPGRRGSSFGPMTESGIDNQNANGNMTGTASPAEEAAAEAWFFTAEPTTVRFTTMDLPPPPRTNRADFDRWEEQIFTPYVQRRQSLLDEAQAGYMRVIAYHAPRWETAAAFRLASLYLSFSRLIASSPVPPDIDPSRVGMAPSMNEEPRSEPFANTASTGFQACVRTGTIFHVSATALRRCTEPLAEIDPRRFPLDDEIVRRPDLVRSGPIDVAMVVTE